jgi:formylmethanofuran dehydrogenase subunit E
MGITNNIKETNIITELSYLSCDQCSQPFTEQEIKEQNFDLWWDTTNDVNLVPMSAVTTTNLYFPSGRKGYQLSIWVRSIEHRYCASHLFEICEDCDERFLKEKVKESQGNYYCEPCLKYS